MDINIRSQDRSEAVKQAGAASAGNVQIDPVASAALEEAIKSAKLGLKPSSPEVVTSNGIATCGRTFPIKLLS